MPFEELKKSVDTYNSKEKGEKLYLHEIVKPTMICLSLHLVELEREEASNSPQLIRERVDRENRIEERKY